MKDQRWISELSPEPRTMYSLHQSLHPGRHPDSDPNPWRRNRLERARDFHEAGTIPQLVYKSKFPRIMGSTAQFFCPGKYHGTMLIQRQPCTHIKKKKAQIAKWPVSNSEVTVLFSLMCLAGLQGLIDIVLWAPSWIEARAMKTSENSTAFPWSSGDSHLLPGDSDLKRKIWGKTGESLKYIMVQINCAHTSLS